MRDTTMRDTSEGHTYEGHTYEGHAYEEHAHATLPMTLSHGFEEKEVNMGALVEGVGRVPSLAGRD